MLADVSAPAFLQWFDGSYRTIEDRVADIFMAGYGQIWTPPPGRADSGNFSVGYDPYDRFDLGKPGNPTLYGTETGLKTTVQMVQRAGMDYYLDFVINHNGFSDLGSNDGQGNSFYDAGGYPGFNISLPNAIDGDFHSKFAGGDLDGRVAGLIDIDHSTNFQMIRSPVDPNAPNNIRPGTKTVFGRIANVPDPNNARFYPDRSLQPIKVYDPTTGEADIAIYPFNNADPLAGDARPENAMGYLMRNAQWLVQAIGVDGFRIDATKHIPSWVLNYFDRAVYRSSFRSLLNGQQKQVFSFGEAYSGDQGYLQTLVRKTIDPNQPGVVGGNRDTLDFPLFFALRENLSNNPFQNNWQNVRNATFDFHDETFHNGSQGVMFVQSHDDFGPYLNNVAHAYVLMHPGNAVVYFNGKEFGNNRDFPKDGRGDALGGLYGDAITTLVNIRNTHGRGNYMERWIDSQGNFAYERDRSAIVMLSNAFDPGYTYDSRTLLTKFPAGTPLIELTGNAADPEVDPPGKDDFPSLVVVNSDKTINVRFPHNHNRNGEFTGKGYFVYGVATPEGELNLTNVVQVLPGGTPGGSTNGTTRLTDIEVVKADSFQVQLDTEPVYLLGSYRDPDADGDNALLRIDGGMDLNANGFVDYVTPGSAAYGFEEFTTKKSPLWGGGDGEYRQTVDATKLAEGRHFITVRAFRHRSDGGPPVFSDFKKVIYVDRLPPEAAIVSFAPIVPGVNENRRLQVVSTDATANNAHVFFDLPASLTNSQILAMVGGSSQTNQIDRDLYTKDAQQLRHGNHVATVVTYEPTGTYNIQRFAGLYTSTSIGAGLGDVNFDGLYSTIDIDRFEVLLNSNNTQFNPAADLTADGRIDNADLLALGPRLSSVNADAATTQAYRDLVAVFLPAEVGSFVWNDLDADGIQDANEPGLPDVTVKLFDQSLGQFVATATTSANGVASFTGLGPGDYAVQVVAPAGYSFSPANQGTGAAIDSNVDPATGWSLVFTLDAEEQEHTIDAGLINAPPSVSIASVNSPRTSAVDQITIQFSEPVSGFDLADLALTADGGANLLTSAQSLTTADSITWTLGNLQNLTAIEGNYLLALAGDGSGIVDLAGLPLADGASTSFAVQTHFPVTTISDNGPGSLRQAILDANASSGIVPIITFDVPGAGPYPIELASPLPFVMHPIVFDVPDQREVKIGTTGFSLAGFVRLSKAGLGTLTLGGGQSQVGPAELIVAAGTLNLDSDLTDAVSLIAHAPVVVRSTQHLRSLRIGAQLSVSGGGSNTIVAGDLEIAPESSLDLADQALIVQATPETRLATLAKVTGYLATGAAGLAWNGPGIHSSTAAADSDFLTAVGVMLNDDGLGNPFHPEFAGHAVDASSILVKTTYYGDADLTSQVDGTDYALIDNGFNAALSGWFNGDFDYNLAIDGTDYALIDNAFNETSNLASLSEALHVVLLSLTDSDSIPSSASQPRTASMVPQPVERATTSRALGGMFPDILEDLALWSGTATDQGQDEPLDSALLHELDDELLELLTAEI